MKNAAAPDMFVSLSGPWQLIQKGRKPLFPEFCMHGRAVPVCFGACGDQIIGGMRDAPERLAHETAFRRIPFVIGRIDDQHPGLDLVQLR